MQSLDTNVLVTTVKSSKQGSSASPIRTGDVNKDIPYIEPNDEIDPTIISMKTLLHLALKILNNFSAGTPQ